MFEGRAARSTWSALLAWRAGGVGRPRRRGALIHREAERSGAGIGGEGAEHTRRPAGPIAQILVPTPATLGQRPTQRSGRRQHEAATTDGGGDGGGLSPRMILVERLPPLGRGAGRLSPPREPPDKRKKKQGAGGGSAGIGRGHPPPPPLPSSGAQPAAPLAHPRGGQQPARRLTHCRAYPTSRR